jgi:hypothetical protein
LCCNFFIYTSFDIDHQVVEKAGPTAEELKQLEAQRLAEEKVLAEAAAKKRTVCTEATFFF